MTNSRKMSMVQWSDLPPELASDIAERLGLVELLSFRSVCKAWNSASSTASAKIESTPYYDPWFLLYGDDHKISDECQLVTESGVKYTMRLPELDGNGTTCLASNEGWVLVFKQGEGEGDCEGSIFFFRPFSRTKIDLPKFPVSQLSDHVAAFSSPPTSQDCRVCVISRSNDDELELNVLHRGDNTWLQHKIPSPRNTIGTIKCAAYLKETVNFFDHKPDKMLILSSDKKVIRPRFTKSVRAPEPKDKSTACYPVRKYFKETKMKKKLGLVDDENVSFSICGTGTQKMSHDDLDMLIFNETISSDHVEESKTKSRQFKGVWIYPRFYQVSPKHQTW